MPIVHGADGPADDEPREQIEDRREVQLAALADHELRRVADPALIRRRGRELPIQQIGGDRLIVVAHRRAFEPLARPRLQAVFLHQSHDALAADVLVLLDQILVDARAAVAMLALLERGPHQHCQPAIVAGMRRFRTALPGVEAAARDAQTATEDRDRMLGLLRGDEPEPYRLCFAKKAAAFLGCRAPPRDAILFAQPGQLLALRRRQPGPALRAIGPCVLDPGPQGRRHEIELAGHRIDAFALVDHEPHGLLLKFFGELPTRASACGVCHRGHRIRLSESVHEIDYEVAFAVQSQFFRR